MRERQVWTQIGFFIAKLILPPLFAWVFGDGDKDKKERIKGRVKYQVEKRMEANYGSRDY